MVWRGMMCGMVWCGVVWRRDASGVVGWGGCGVGWCGAQGYIHFCCLHMS